MAKDVESGVVDAKLRVFGVDNLRVIDASVIPVIPDCRIQNSVYMIAEKVCISLVVLETAADFECVGCRPHQGCSS